MLPEEASAGKTRDGRAARWPAPYWWIDIGKTSMVLMLATHDAGLAALPFDDFAHWERW